AAGRSSRSSSTRPVEPPRVPSSMHGSPWSKQTKRRLRYGRRTPGVTAAPLIPTSCVDPRPTATCAQVSVALPLPPARDQVHVRHTTADRASSVDGGVLSRVFAHLYPSETGGLVLIDTIGRDGRRRQLAIWPRSQAREI